MATLSTGEHYVTDLVAGLAFGCFAANVGFGRYHIAFLYLGVVLSWSLAIRFAYGFLIAHTLLLRSFALLTVGMAIVSLVSEWRVSAVAERAPRLRLCLPDDSCSPTLNRQRKIALNRIKCQGTTSVVAQLTGIENGT